MDLSLLIVTFNYALFTYFDVSNCVKTYLNVSGIVLLFLQTLFFMVNNYFTIKFVEQQLIEGQKRYPLYQQQKPIYDKEPEHLFDTFLRK